ncbi:MAG TPA: ABC transporter substrate-binding protein [Methylomirabilota bacterium]|nr:ABC transporter substrate-binding protein [Methylomirabilota bacterium]
MNRRRFLTSTAAGLGGALAPAIVRAEEPIKIGVLLPFSKAFAVLGENTFAGFTLGLKEVGPEIAGRKYVVVKEDDTADPSVGVSKVRKLIDKDDVDVVVGTIHSGVAAAIRNPIVDAKRLWLNPIATNDLLVEQGCSRYHFRFSNSGWQSSAPLAPWAKAKFGDRAYVCAFNFAFGQQTAAHFKKAFEGLGGKVLGESFPPFGTTNFAPYFPAIKDARPQFIFANFAGPDAVAFVKQFADFGLASSVKIVAPSNLVSEDVLHAQGEAAVGIYSISYYTPSYDIPKNRWFVKACKEQLGKDADHFMCAGYDVAHALFGALRETRGDASNRERLASIIEAMKLDSPRGRLRWDPKNHNPIQDLQMRVVQTNPLRHVVVDILKDVTHPDTGLCKL